MQIVRTLPTDQWSAFVDQHPKGNVFHTPEMFEVYRQAKGHRPELWAALEHGEVVALFIPVHISLREGLLRRLTTRTVAYGGVLSAPGEKGREALRCLLEEYKAASGRQSLFTEMRNVFPLEELQPVLKERGFAYEDHLNYLIDLNQPVEAVFQQIGKRTRKNIKSGLHKGAMSVEEATRPSDTVLCYDLLKKTYDAVHVPLADRSLFEAAFCVLRPLNMIRFALARAGNQPAAVSIELLYKDVVYGWYGGMDRSFAAYVPNELLMWNILEWGATHGFRQYDFGGAGKPHERYGVRTFKAKFGGKLVCYGRNIWIPKRSWYLLSKAAYATLRPLL